MTGHALQPTARPVRPPFERVRREQAPRRTRRRPLAWFVALVLLVLSVPIVFRGMDDDGPTPIAQLLAFLPWFLVPGWLALLYAVLARRGFLALWAIVVLAATVGYTLPQGPDAPAGAAERTGKARFRVLTANLRYGSATDALLTTLRRERPQIVAVQECDGRCATALRGTRMREEYPYRHIIERSGAGGSALLSTFPLKEKSTVPGTLAMPGAVADVSGTNVKVQVAHPMPPQPDALGSWRKELGALRAYGASRGSTPAIVAGDFNSSQDHAAFRSLLGTGLNDAARLTGQSRTPTWPNNTPLRPMGAQIDHVLVSDPLTAVEAQFVELAGSDHLGVLADVKLF
ncbi:endonuclease/exonuclease/phosphatase (EEP) superfamily protein YafD [Streptomyces sp. Amel2xB2]|uniref:endonuclease/exonuclease/phosphatase family protein n=1 Tax=Streptomyces sp. Amel2xB2 TaxID=1305829 RepID=UPI000DBF581C|nr:endonuclease/exonuclease/phosphatase family protein [Streptomyces sp. Amel2xB2]RAJ56638.1 endonuclease/exonuclease/phosphatase (EEP) superfamily protein YafD [Streptomyces sp. Amel2xB2]